MRVRRLDRTFYPGGAFYSGHFGSTGMAPIHGLDASDVLVSGGGLKDSEADSQLLYRFIE